jgi:hypothetical protein
MTINPLKFDWKKSSKGQSFVELTLILIVLLTLLAGMVEFGNLLNQYINLVDGAREGARFGSNDDPFESGHYEVFFSQIYETVQGKYDDHGVQLSKGAINPILLSKENGDDIVVTVYSVTANAAAGTKALVKFVSAAGSRYNNHASSFTSAEILAKVDADAPSTGLLVVEIFYNYNQILKLFSITGIPDPLLVHTYAIMPLSAAEPTPTPRPSP